MNVFWRHHENVKPRLPKKMGKQCQKLAASDASVYIEIERQNSHENSDYSQEQRSENHDSVKIIIYLMKCRW